MQALRTLPSLVFAVLALALCACGPSKDPNVYSSKDLVRSPRPARGTVLPRPTQRLTSVTGSASGASADTDPEALAALQKSLLLPAVLVGLSEPPPRVLALSLDGTTRGQVDGMMPDGPSRLFRLGEGEHARLSLSLPIASCWTVVAQGGLGVVELDLFLRADVEQEKRVVAQDLSHGPSAVLGGRDGCFTAVRELSAELLVLARRGGGDVLFRVYRR